jgi:hypothetical protein
VALAQLGTLDLSMVTDALLTQLHDSYTDWPLWDTNGGPITKFSVDINGSMPESVRDDGGCQLTLYLLHITENKHLKNTPVRVSTTPLRTRALTIPLQPLALDLYYLLTAFAGKQYRQEQRAMSIAVRSLFEHPILRIAVPIAGTLVPEELTLQMQVESADELGRVWQSFSTPFRLSAVYRVSVAFVTPQAPDSAPAPPPERIVIAAEPAPAAAGPQVLGTVIAVEGFAPSSTVVKPLLRRYELSPAVVPRGGAFLLLGRELAGPASKRVYLLSEDGTEEDVTSWLDPDPDEARSSRLALVVPSGAGGPVAGVYRVCVGSDVASGDATTARSNATGLSVAARVGPATNPPLLAPAAGVYTLSGMGFVAAGAEVSLGTTPLARVPGAPGSGEFRVVNQSTITFAAPAGLAAGIHEVQVRVNGVQSPPEWWVSVP